MNTANSPLRWLAAFAVTAVIAALSLLRYAPPLPAALTLDLVVGQPGIGKSEPLVTSGRPQAGDFLFLRHTGENVIVFGYETWGSPSLLSSPVQLPPDRRLRLELEVPAFTRVRGALAPASDQLRLVIAGRVIFNQSVDSRWRLGTEIRFAENHIGGTTCDATLTGHLLLPDGRELRGAPTVLLDSRARLGAWLTVTRWPALTALLLGVAMFALWPRLVRTEWTQLCKGASRALARHRWFAGAAAICVVSFAWLVTCGTFRVVAPEIFSSFYDYQAQSLLLGRLDVPEESLGGEAFVFDGKIYGYFGLTPALLRLPLVIFDVGFAELSRAFMLLYFAGALVAAHLLLRETFRLAGRSETHGTPPAWATVSLTLCTGLGSTLFFLGSRANIYHEAILCGAAFALWGAWCALRHFSAPSDRWWLGALVCGVLAVHARPPVGFFALTLVGTVALAVAWRDRGRVGWRSAQIAALAGAGVLSFNVVSYAKFQTFEGCPLRYNVQYDATRLARIEGKQFHLANLPIAVDCYLVARNFHVEPSFPFFFINTAVPGREWIKTKIDYHDPTLGFPFAMPTLFGLATLGGIGAWFAVPALRGVLLAMWLAAVPMTLAMFAAIAITHRYTADFCPLLIGAAAFGLVALDRLRPPWRGLARGALGATVVASVLITLAISFHYQGQEAWGTPAGVRENYSALRQRVDAALAPWLPPASRP